MPDIWGKGELRVKSQIVEWEQRAFWVGFEEPNPVGEVVLGDVLAGEGEAVGVGVCVC